ERVKRGQAEAEILSILSQNLHHFLERVPAARGRRNAEDLFDLPEVADRFHLPAIDSEHELILDRDNFEKPVFVRGQSKRKRRKLGRLFVQYAGKPRDVRAGWLPCKWIFARKIDNRFGWNDHDLAFER